MNKVATFNSSCNAAELEFTFSATLENINKAVSETIDFLTTAGKEEISFSITLIMRESLINAIVHGRGSGDQKIVKCNIRLGSDHLVLEVEDEGRSFDWEGFLNKEPLSIGGSGLRSAIIKKYCTDVKYSANGNKLLLTKKIT